MISVLTRNKKAFKSRVYFRFIVYRWWKDERFAHTNRTYNAKDVAVIRPTISINTPSHYLSRKLYFTLRRNFNKGACSNTFGALDNIQAITMSKHLSSIYVSGWQLSSNCDEPGPDFADYPSTTVPDHVKKIVNAQMFHDRKQNEERSNLTKEERNNKERIDFLTPIIADADAGFGGVTSVMKIAKAFIEAGVAGIHIEDQKAGAKKCGHLGGKVLVNTKEQMQRLYAARLQADIMGCDLVIVARTDAYSASFIDTNIDPLDHPYILGVVDENNPELLMTFPTAGQKVINETFLNESRTNNVMKLWNENCTNMSLKEAIEFAKELGFELKFDWEACRSEEGYYKLQGNLEYCVKRGLKFSECADLLWMETPLPDLKLAKGFADGIHAVKPHQMLSYNLSPSFNWDASGMSEEEISQFIPTLGKMGYCWQFITLAGFHLNSLMTEIFAREISSQNMMKYVELIQRAEKKENVAQLKHQQWSGVDLRDKEVELSSPFNVSTKANSEGCTEVQFGESKL
jgi:isocitrate lyase